MTVTSPGTEARHKPTPLQIRADTIPGELKQRPQWVCWRYSWNGGDKWDKPPYTVNDGKASTTDPASWSDFESAIAASARFDGIGITCADGLAGADLDNCIDDDGNLSELARYVVNNLNTYTEFSPSGRGLRCFFRGALPDGRRKDPRRGFEIYNSGRYLTVTGQHLAGTPRAVEERTAQAAEVHRHVFGERKPPAPPRPASPNDMDDSTLIEKALSATNGGKFSQLWAGNWQGAGYKSQSEADLALCSHLAFWTGGDAGRIDRLFRCSGLRRDKWDDPHNADGTTYGAMTIARALENATEFYQPSPRSGLGVIKADRTGTETDSTNRSNTQSSKTSKPHHEGKESGPVSRKAIPTNDVLRDNWLHRHPNTLYGLGEFRRYANGAWLAMDLDAARREVMEILEYAKPEGVRPTARLAADVLEMARLKISIPADRWDANADILVCANRTLHIPSRTLRAHNPLDYATNALGFDYDPDARAPTWDYLLESTIPESAGFVQEFAGYCLTPDTRHETALWLYGPPGSGKSTSLAGLQSMLGKKAGVLGLGEIERSAFALAGLPGKTLVVSTEQPSDYLRVSHVLNAIISGEVLNVDRKFRDAIQIAPRAKIAWAMSDLPRVPDAGDGLFRRVKVVSFPARAERDRDPEVKIRVMQEGAGILIWALAGLERLRARGRFEIPECVHDATSRFQQTNDIAALFIEERCLQKPDCKVQSAVLYSSYKDWCITNGHRPKSATSVASDWYRLGFERREKDGRRYWHGLELRRPQRAQ